MASKKYVKLPGSERKPIPAATQAGSVSPDEPMRVTVVLRARESKAEKALQKLVAKGESVSREEYEARYGASRADVRKVAEFASEHSLSVEQVNAAGRTVTLTGTCFNFAKAFQVKLERYELAGGSYRGRTGPVKIPAELEGIVVAVHGLDNRPQARAHFRIAGAARPAVSAVANTSYTPLQIAKAYNFPSGNGAGQTIGIIELGGGYNLSELQSYFKGLKLTPPTIVAVSVDGAQNQPNGDPNGPDTEVALDIEVAGAVAPGARIVVYFAPNSDSGFLDAINQAAMDKVNQPSVISISWGGPESSWTAQSLQTYNSALQAATAVGVTVCVASGDNGSADGVSDGQDHVDFPASSPYALGCGGTSLSISGSTIRSEVVWNGGSGGGATGGGVSETFALPSWQANAKVPVSKNRSKYKGRGVPDISGDADPATGYQVTSDGSSFTVGGTSAVAPLWAGLIALFNQSLKKPVGYLNPTLYQAIANTAGTLRDITSGNNGDYSAGPGWDACTGWGSPNGAALLSALSGSGSPPSKPPKPPKPPKKHHPPKRHKKRKK
jgi:kumamolisin